MNSDVIKLFRLILERNKLAKVRTSARMKLQYTRKTCAYIMRYASPMKMMGKFNIDKLSLLCKQLEDYKKACHDLAEFTRANSKFRSYMRKNYKTKQSMSASNYVTSLYIDLEDGLHIYSIEDIESAVTNDTVNNILLGLPII